MTSSAASSSPTPRSVVCVKVDTLGDLVLFAPGLQALRTGWPNARISVVIREAYADLASLLVTDVEWITTSLDPFSRGPLDDPRELSRLREIAATQRPDVLVAATSKRNWLEIALAAASDASRLVALGAGTEDEFFATQLRVQLGIDARAAFSEHVAVGADESDAHRGLTLAAALLGKTIAQTSPRIQVPAAARTAIDPFLSQHRLEFGKYAVCAAAGFANVELKTWPAERFGAVVRHVHAQHGVRTILVGHESERAHLANVAAAAGGEPVIWVGKQGTLPQLAALISGATVYVGNDTGAMHLAAALDIPVVAVFGGGTWPRFVPAAKRSVSVVQPLPCFGCGWDCAFGDAPCLGGIAVEEVTEAVDRLLANTTSDFAEIHRVEHLSAETRTMMDKAAARYRAMRRDHLARQHKLEELTALDREKDAAIAEKEAEIAIKEREINSKEREIDRKEVGIQSKEAEIDRKQREIYALKATCDEREKTIFTLDGHVRNLQAQLATAQADKAALEKTLRDLPPDAANAARAMTDQAVHIRNIEALVKIREQELAEARASITNHEAGLHDLEQAKHYSRLLAEKEAVIQSLNRACQEREVVIKQLTAEATTITAKLAKLGGAARAFWREKVARPTEAWLFRTVVENYWMQIGILQHYAPRPLKWDDRLPGPRLADSKLPQIGIVTPSYGQEKFVERTLRSVLDQHYPKLRYVVQDGGSKDRSPEIIGRYADRLHYWESVRDKGQADAIGRGFKHIVGALDSDDVMAWLNSDDLFGPGVLRFVAEYFARHPDVDAVYGHRIIIDDEDRDVGRWIMPRHKPARLEWIDYVPQETLFWRKRAWNLVGGIDPSFQFALDWDLLARFHQAGCKIVRVPYFLGAFRVHAEQKTTQVIHSTGADEMRRIRTRFHGARQDDAQTIERHARDTRFWGAVTARLHEVGIRW